MSTSYAGIKPKLYAEIDGKRYDVVGYTASFEINNIPFGSIVLPVGQDMRTGQVAELHERVQLLRQQLPVKVYLEATVVEQYADSGLGKFDTPRLIFEGVTSGTGWRRTNNVAFFVVNMLHWLVHLNHSSAISAASHPSNPADWVFPAGFRAISPLAGDATGQANLEGNWTFLSNSRAKDPGAFTDIWENIIKPHMLDVAKQDPIDSRLLAAAGAVVQANALSESQQRTVDALNRITSAVELAMDFNGADGPALQNGIINALSKSTGESWINVTLWGKLIAEYSPAFWLGICPRIEDALIAPMTGPLRGTPSVVIGAEDYLPIDASAASKQLLRGVGIVHPVKSGLQGDTSLATAGPAATGLAGFYTPGTVTDGLIMLKQAPPWVIENLPEYTVGARVEGANAVGTVVDPPDQIAVAPNAPDPVAKAAQLNLIMNRFAQQYYAIEALKGRTGELAGKLRFDICPGSTVKIKARSARNLQADQDQLAADRYALVIRVSYTIDAAQPQAGTAFTVAHIRTEDENTDDSTSVERPALYLNKWMGASMLDYVDQEQEQ